MRIEIGQIISQIISFLILYWIFNRFGWQPLLKVMRDRRNKIQSELDQIDEEKLTLAKTEIEYNRKFEEIEETAQKRIHEAVERGRQLTFEIEQAAHVQAKKIVEKAEEEAQLEIKKAQSQLKDEIIRLTLDATKLVLQKELNEGKQKELINDFVNQAVNK